MGVVESIEESHHTWSLCCCVVALRRCGALDLRSCVAVVYIPCVLMIKTPPVVGFLHGGMLSLPFALGSIAFCEFWRNLGLW